ncbi:MAG TPA: class I SAM-dependent methyltransferase [Chthoniobacterales bacterium]|jgi:SAM-dependent methyltransferase|nr:class I SAM-dependent methyltransferase [Chthoniobacterales bacterium]
MKLSRKLAKLVSQEGYRRAWRRAQRSIFRLPFGPVLAGIDQNRLREIQNRYAGEKYAAVDHWLRVNRERVQDLKLHRFSPQRVLDLGCGGGYFLFILKRFNHSVLGLDVDRLPLFQELLEIFGVPRIVFEIKPFEPLPNLRQQFDWITAFSIGFDRHRETNARWGVKEWDFLLRDLQGHLAPAGKIFLAVNPLPDDSYLAPEVRDFFLSRGADIERERIFFRHGLRN